MQNVSRKLRLSVFIGPFCLLVATGCGPETPPPADDIVESVCCETEDGTEYTSNIACNEASGTAVPISQCESICCHQEGDVYAWLAPADCMGNGGLSSFPAHCAEVCCDIEGQVPSYLLQGNCASQGGTEVANEVCEPQEDICCRYEDGTFGLTSAATCETDAGAQTTPENCEDVCCSVPDQPAATMLAGACTMLNGTVLPDEDCEPVEEKTCCKTEAGIAWVPVDDCLPGNVLNEDLCERPYCCKIMDGPDAGNALMLSWPDCVAAGGSVVYEGYCEQTICCETETGPQLVPYVDCTFLQLTQTSDCDPVQDEACCKIMDGPGAGNAFLATPSDCAGQGGAYVPAEFCSQVLCCNTDDGPQLIPYEQCTFLQLLATSDCDPPQEEKCCKIMIGPGLGNAFMATPEDCVSQNGAVMDPEYCTQELCCDTGDGPQIMPYMECTFLQLLATDECTPPEEEQCCKISFGVDTGNVVMATPSDCAEEGGIITVQEYCDQQFCCETEDGFQMLPFLECPFLSINWTGACDEPMVCCATSSLPEMLPESECLPDNVLPDPACDNTICCSTGDGNFFEGTDEECETSGGTPIDPLFCDPNEDPMVCCVTNDDEAYIPQSECVELAGNVTPSACVVCCEYPGGGVGMDPTEFCLAGQGTIVADEVCNPPAMVCCQLGEEASYIQDTDCTEQGGTTTDIQECQVCCKNPFGNGPEFVFEEVCLANGSEVNPDSVCE